VAILKRFHLIILFLLIAGISVYFHTVNLHADPPIETFLEAGDEGTHSYAARQLYLKGDWATDGVYFGGMMPVYPLLQVTGVVIFGVHNYAFRFVNVVFSLATSVVLFWFLSREVGKKSAFIGFASLGLSFFFTLYSKTGLPEATMVFFSLCSFISYYYALVAEKKYFLHGVVTGLFLVLAFFTKQSSASLVGMIGLTGSVFYIREYFRTRVVYNKYARIAVGIAVVWVVFIGMYVVTCVLPAYDKWLKNIPGTWGGNRPRRALLQPLYSLEQLRFTLFNPLWSYLHFVTVGTCTYLGMMFTRIYRWQNHRGITLLEMITVAWLLIFLGYMFVIPLKGARFFILIIIPMTLLYSYLFKKEHLNFLHKRFGFIFVSMMTLFVVIELIVNIGYNTWYFVYQPQFQTFDSLKKLERYVPKNEKSNLPVQWIMNDTYDNINSFLVPVDDRKIDAYYSRYGWPHYMVIINRQIEMYKKNAPKFYKRLVFVTVVNGYTVYSIKQP